MKIAAKVGGAEAIEPQVDVMGGLLHQFFETKSGEVK